MLPDSYALIANKMLRADALHGVQCVSRSALSALMVCVPCMPGSLYARCGRFPELLAADAECLSAVAVVHSVSSTSRPVSSLWRNDFYNRPVTVSRYEQLINQLGNYIPVI